MKRKEFKYAIENSTMADGTKPLRVRFHMDNIVTNQIIIEDVKGKFSIASISENVIGRFKINGMTAAIVSREGLSEQQVKSVADCILQYSFTPLEEREELEAENSELTLLNRKLEQHIKELKAQQEKAKNILE